MNESYMAVLAEHNLPALSPDPNPLGLWMSTSDRVSHFDIGGVSLPHLSPGSTYQDESLGVDPMSTPPHHSPHHYSEASEGCSGLIYPDFTTVPGCDMISQQYHTGERSPDSGIYSPTSHSPQAADYDTLALADTLTPSSTLSMPLTCTSTHEYIANSIYSTCNLSPRPQPPPLFSSIMPYPPTSSLNFNEIPMFVRDPLNDGTMDPNGPIPIITHDQATGVPLSTRSNPIHFYPDCSDLPPPHYMDPTGSPSCIFPGARFSEDYARPPPPPPRNNKRQRKHKVPASVDPSEIKDIPASAQLWEFLLKVLKKPKYSYMVSWENQKEGLFRFHDPPAFAALWGRHRNRPSMTYDKVARALRYYYKRDILEQVGGRLTYKFSTRLCKQFTDRPTADRPTSSED